MDESGPKKIKRARISHEDGRAALLRENARRAHEAAIEATERELRGEPINDSSKGRAVVAPTGNEGASKQKKNAGHTPVAPNLGGFLSQKYKRELGGKVDSALATVFELEANELDNRLSGFYSGMIPLSKFEKTFRSTCIKRVKLAMVRGEIRPESETLESDIASLVRKAIEDFFTSLRASQERGDTKTQAFSIAANSHWLLPDALETLAKEYPRVDKAVLYRAVEGYPSAPVGYIEGYLQRLEGLKKNSRTKNVSLGILKYAALHVTNKPEKFIGHYQRVLAAHSTDATPEVKKNIVERAARRRLSGKFLREYASRTKVLEGERRFSHLGKSTIERTARDYTSLESARKFLSWYAEAYEYLLSFEPRKGLVRDILFSNAFRSKEELKKLV